MQNEKNLFTNSPGLVLTSPESIILINVRRVGDNSQRHSNKQPYVTILIKTTENYRELVLPDKQHLKEFTWKSSLVKIKSTTLGFKFSVLQKYLVYSISSVLEDDEVFFSKDDF